MSQAINGQDKDLREWAGGKFVYVNTQLRGLKEFAVAVVEKFVQQKFSHHAGERSLSPGVQF